MVDNKEIKTVAKGAGIVFIGLFLSKILGYLYRMIIARIGPEEYGLLSIGIAIVSIISFFPLMGLDLGVLRYVAFYKGKNNESKIKGTIFSAVKISLPLSLIFSAIILIFSETIAINIFHDKELINVIRTLTFFIPFLALSNIFLSTIKSFQKIKYLVFTKNIMENLTKVVITAILIFLGKGLFGATIAYVIAIFTTFILSLYLLRYKTYNIFNKIKPKYSTKELIKYSWPLMFSLLLAQVITWTDVLMLGSLKNAFEVGIYNAALPTVALMNVIPGALIVLFVPLMTELYAKNKKDNLESLFKTISKWIFFSNIIVFFLMNIFAKDILKILFGQVYIKGAFALVILTLGYFMYYNLFVASVHMLEVIKKTKYVMFNSLIAAIVNITLNYIFIPKYGMLGGAIATSISMGIYGLLSAIETFIFTKLVPIKLNYIKAISSGFIASFIVYYLKKPYDIKIPELIIFSIIFLVIYLFLILIMKSLEKEDVEILKAVERRTNIKLEFVRNFIKRFI